MTKNPSDALVLNSDSSAKNRSSRQKGPLPFQSKIVVPTSAKTIARPRLFQLLEEAAERPLTWITARAGAGKTTLALEYLRATQTPFLWYTCDREDSDLASFFYYMKQAARQSLGGRSAVLPLLHPEYLSGLPSFTRRFFEQLSRGFLPLRRSVRTGNFLPGVIVLDNYQDLPAGAALHALLHCALEGMQQGARMLVLSREEPPAQIVRLVATRQVARLDDETLRFNREETVRLVESLKPGMRLDALEQIYEQTQGWAAGITLLLENLQAHPHTPVELSLSDCNSIFDYFANEVFLALPSEVQNFLLRAALLPVISVHACEQLSGYPQAQQLLNTFCRSNLFTKMLSGRQSEYLFHPLWREFLLSRLRATLPLAELNRLRCQAGQLLELHQNHEGAARLYGEARASAELARLIHAHAAQLLGQGRNQTLQEWLSALDEDFLLDPWLAYWRGRSAFPLDIPLAVQYLEEALQRFETLNERKGIFLAWAALVDAHAYSLDDWKSMRRCLEYFERQLKSDAVFPDAETERIALSSLLTALTLICTDQPGRMDYWLERIAQLQQEAPSLELKISTLFNLYSYYLWKGEYEKNDGLLENALAELPYGRLSPILQIRIKLIAGIQAWSGGRYEQAHAILQQGLQLSAESGMRIFDSLLWGFRVAACLVRCEFKRAAQLLQQQMQSQIGPTRSINQFFYSVNVAWLALLEGQPRRADQHLKMASPVVQRTGNPYCRGLWLIGMAKTTFLLEDPEAALAHLQEAEAVAQAMQSTVLDWSLSMVRAWILFRQKRDAEALATLRHALGLARAYRYLHLEFYLPDAMQLVLSRALEVGIEVEYVRHMIRTLRLAPPSTPASGAAEFWPYPVRIYTMGRFEVFIEEELLEFSGKEQKKPLEMLKLLIALGGSNVAEEILSDQLWPETDGDLAHKSFETTLGRLRRLLGDDASIHSHGRKLTLNPHHCWVDSLVLCQQLQAIDHGHLQMQDPALRQIFHLASDVFLPKEQGSVCIQEFRNRLTRNLLQVLLAHGKACEKLNHFAAASLAYQRGIALDTLAEEFYRRLMHCQRQLGNHSEAARIYLNCREQLRYRLGIEPSPQTTALYLALGRLES